ncbi:MAG: V-type ATP synthase subunit E [Candidatus Saliniplasma sp.]
MVSWGDRISVDDIIQRINADVEQKIKHIKKREKQKEKKEIAKLEKEKEQRIDKIKKEGEREINTMKNRLISQANLKTRKNKLKVREDIFQEVFEQARNKLKDSSPEEYEDYIRKAIGRAEKILEEEVTIHCNESSKDIVENLSNKINPKLKVQADLDCSGGIKAESREGTVLDMTFEANLKRIKKELRKEISDILFTEE